MKDAIQNPVVCATRGGEGSLAVQIEAIKRAKSTNSKLVFLFITDPLSVSTYESGLVTAVEAELNWLGETMLRIAQRRADSEGVVSEVRVRQGQINSEIGKYLQESSSQLLLLGAPRGTTANVFGDDAIEQFAQEIEAQHNIEVVIVRPEGVETR